MELFAVLLALIILLAVFGVWTLHALLWGRAGLLGRVARRRLREAILAGMSACAPPGVETLSATPVICRVERGGHTLVLVTPCNRFGVVTLYTPLGHSKV